MIRQSGSLRLRAVVHPDRRSTVSVLLPVYSPMTRTVAEPARGDGFEDADRVGECPVAFANP